MSALFSEKHCFICRAFSLLSRLEVYPIKNKNQNDTDDDRAQNQTAPSTEALEKELRAYVETVIESCKTDHSQAGFLTIEKTLCKQIFHLGCLCIQLLLAHAHARLRYGEWLKSGKYYSKDKPIARTIKTIFGQVRYWRRYLAHKNKAGGFYPLDAVLGLTADGFTPLVISLCTRLATRMSFAASKLVFDAFCHWSPSTEAIGHLALGLGKGANTFMEEFTVPDDDGEVLVIEVDGKATPTATARELKKRRGKRRKKKRGCGCQRHRGKSKRKSRKQKRKGKSKRRKKGDKSKNGRSITLVSMYTLKRDEDGRLCGPINKKVWGSYAPRKTILAWARRQATRRGFGLGSGERIHIVVDGEVCLRKGLSELFPGASFALDIRHLEEKLWDVGRAYHKESSEELAAWVDEMREFLYTGHTQELLEHLKDMEKRLSSRAKRDRVKRKTLKKLINYMESRLEMMNYKELLEEDLPIGSGIIEGAVRHVVGERMDCSGMRWIPERAEAILHLRCIELNGDWDDFIEWDYARRRRELMQGQRVMVRTTETIDISNPNYMKPEEHSNAA